MSLAPSGRHLRSFAHSVLLAGTALALLPVAVAQAQTSASEQRRSFQIAAQPLEDALRQFTRQSGVQVGYEPDDVVGRTSAPVSGAKAPAEALSQLLAGTGLTYRYTTANAVRLERAPQVADGTVQLGTLRVEGAGSSRSAVTSSANGNVAAWDGTASSVYITPGSVSVITKETLDAYPAQSPADMLRGVTGIISGEARTSGGLDINIRGLQGQGRVPVTVDGAINGTTVYRGYQGTSNRSFVDPDFISHVSIEKGPSNGTAIAGGIGGSISMTTLSANDIVPEGETMAIRLKASFSNNSSEPGSNMTRTLIEPQYSYGSALAATRENHRPGFLSPAGGSASFLFAKKNDVVDFLAGYSFRRTGNYHAGDVGQYAPKETTAPSDFCVSRPNESICQRAIAYYNQHGSTPFAGGEEVYNSSTDTESVLVKATIRPADDHMLGLGYGGYWSRFGENYPGALGGVAAAVYQSSALSGTSLDRFTARYRWNPDNAAIDLKLNGWISRLRESAPSLDNSDPTRRYVNSWGVDFTNSSQLSTAAGLFSADYGASYLTEDAGPVDSWRNNDVTPPGREGVRKEVSLFAQAILEPTVWLRLDAGARYQHYDLDDRQSGSAPRSEILSRSEGAFNFSLGAALMPVDGLQLFASYKQAARLPSLMEATSGFFYVANPNLHKEVARNWEFGVNYDGTGLLTDTDELGVKLVWFDNDIDGYIARRWVPTLLSMEMFNIDRARFRGLEGNISYKTGGFSIHAGASYYDRIQFCRPDATACADTSLAADFATNYIPPRWSANLSVNQKFLNDRATLGARLSYIGNRAIAAETPPGGLSPFIKAIAWNPYVLVDMTGSYKLNDALAVNWSIDNLTDRYYNEAMSLGYVPAPGRTFRIGFTSLITPQSAIWPGQWFSRSGNMEAVNWTGPYVGGSFGYGFGQTKGTVTDSAGNPTDLINNSQYRQKMDNVLGGLQAGYNYQLSNNIVIGIEGDITTGNLASWTGVGVTGTSGNIAFLQQRGFLESDTQYEWDRLTTLRGRLGYSLGRTLIYGMGGMAWMRETQTRNQYRSAAASNGADLGVGNALEHYFTERNRATRRGFIVGGGLERSIGSHWSFRTEYSYARFGQKQIEHADAREGMSLAYSYFYLARDPVTNLPLFDPITNFPVLVTETGVGAANVTNGRVNRSNADLHSVRVGISYRF